MSSLIRVLLFDWMVTWRGPEGVGLVELVFFLLLPGCLLETKAVK